MADLPILHFPSPTTVDRTMRHGMVSPKDFSLEKQRKRMLPVLDKLERLFDARCTELRHNMVGIEPELALVIETRGTVENFANAVRRVQGFEFITEYDAEDADDLDKDLSDEDKLGGRVFMVMSNQTALQQVLSLWRRYEKTPALDFRHGELRGFAKFRDVFQQMKDMRLWDERDRLQEQNILEVWEEQIERIGSVDYVKFEAELWCRNKNSKRIQSQSIVENIIKDSGGRVISSCTLPEIAYHSVLGEMPSEVAKRIIDGTYDDKLSALVKCDSIMYFVPTGQLAAPISPDIGEPFPFTSDDENSLPSGDPTIAVLDGLPMENHKLLEGRIVVDDPDNYAAQYTSVKDRQHGTAMSSLVVHGDLENGSAPLTRPVYVRPIMRPDPNNPNSPKQECMPNDIILVDYIHRAVRRIVEGEGDADPVAASVRVINISLGMNRSPFLRQMSPLARLLDWLSMEYNVLFVISAGNHLAEVDIGMPAQQLRALSKNEREFAVVEAIYRDARNRTLLSPAESINGLTVGGLHKDSSSINPGRQEINVIESEITSPISAFGLGHRSSVKPDMIVAGGRVLHTEILVGGGIKPRPTVWAPGCKVATPGATPGANNGTKYSVGTSNSAALTSRAASFCYDVLETLFRDHHGANSMRHYDIPLLKAMLVHGCSWNPAGDNLRTLLESSTESKKLRRLITKWVGYGVPEFGKALACHEQRATLIGFGELKRDNAHAYTLPLPASLDQTRCKRKLTVTLAWLSPIAATTQRYRSTRLWFDFQDGSKPREQLEKILKVKGIDCNSASTKKGTVQHEIFEGNRLLSITQGANIKIRVNCATDAEPFDEEVRYGLVVSLEVAPGIDLPIYQEVKSQIAVAADAGRS